MNHLKRFLTLLLAFSAAVAALALCACQPADEGDKITYTITVVLEDGSGVPGVNVTWGTAGSATTDSDGVASKELPKASYPISLSSLPEGYTYDGNTVATGFVPSVKITLHGGQEDTGILYTVRVVDPDGLPVENIFLQLCVSGDEGSCTPFEKRTDANGETSRTLPAGNYHVKILQGIPEGLTYDQDDGGYYTGAEATPETPSVTVTLKRA